ncbi:MAG: aminotransferase class V-fold PLP-dependent enzyme [Chloroflexi bacterium]|jgi:cysteine desulfurase/selenocysteine lyase|nr:aminotransferase class V-fold PLP-dependent enzyme [Chloroflexota bacterium]
MIYLDYAATSWPKPPAVTQSMTNFLERAGGNPGRSGHRLSIAAGRIVFDARDTIADFFGAADPLRVIFTCNVTQALNLVFWGMLRPGDHVVTSSIEHNSVMRPLRALERQGVQLTIVPCAADGTLDLNDLAAAMQPRPTLVVLNHASNVTGTLLPVAEAARIAHQAGSLIMVDAAQTAGVLPINVQEMDIDLLAFTGHKGLLGPPGTGGLVIASHVDVNRIQPIICGGTGSRSEFEEQPDMLPDKFESGTPNGVGIAGLAAGISYVREQGVEAIRAHERSLTHRLIEGLMDIPGVTVHGPQNADKQTATVSITVQGLSVSEIGFRLDEEYAILTRVGLHCAPAAHRTIGTFPDGTVRLAPGIFTTMEDIEHTLKAIERICRP